jgi:O-antigen/teichoic acid export membrane protein
VFQLIALVFGVTALKLELGLPAVIAAFALASIFNFTFSLSLIKLKWRLSLKPVYDRAIVKWLIAITVPFALYAVFQRLYTYLDTVFLSILADDREVGLYQIAFKVVLAFQFLPMAFTASLYPAFASYWRQVDISEKKNIPRLLASSQTPPSKGESSGQLAITFERAMKYLMIIAVPISSGLIILADQVIVFFRAEYAAAVPVLQIAMISLIFLFLNFPPGALLNACDRQKINTRNMAITLFASVILNIILISRYGALGASLTLALTSLILFSLNMRAAGEIITEKKFVLLLTAAKVTVAAVVMGVIIHILKDKLYIFLNIILGAFVYFAALYLLKGFRKEDVFSILASFKSRKI